MSDKTLTLYAKKTGCPQCDMTKRRLVAEGIAAYDGENPRGVTSTVPGLDIKTVYIDQPENAHILADLKSQGLMEAPVVMVNFPVSVDGVILDHWSGFQPVAIKATVQAVKPVTV